MYLTKTLRLSLVAEEKTDIEKVRALLYTEQYYQTNKKNLPSTVTINKYTKDNVSDDPVIFRNVQYPGYVIDYTLQIETLTPDIVSGILVSAFPADKTLEKRKSRRPIQVVKVEVL